MPAQPSSVFERLGLLPRDTTTHAPVHVGVCVEDARLPVRERLHDGSTTTATSRQTAGTQEFSLAEIARLRGILGGVSHDGILDGDFTAPRNTFSQPLSPIVSGCRRLTC